MGEYDGRVTAVDSGIAGSVDPNSGGNDPTMTAVGGVYTAMWNVYLNDELKYTSTSPFMEFERLRLFELGLSDMSTRRAREGWRAYLYTAGDLAAAMALNPYLKVFSANGYYDCGDALLPDDLEFREHAAERSEIRENLTVKNYKSGHMIYLDNSSRVAMKADLAQFYSRTKRETLVSAVAGVRRSRGVRRFSRTPY